MTLTLRLFVLAAVTTIAGAGPAMAQTAAWLDQPKPASWNTADMAIPEAPKSDAVDVRCSEQARPPELAADKLLRERGWDLVGAYEGGWDIVVIRAAAGYDGMCRPMQHQAFVFVRGVFAGTLSPQPMNSRTDGTLGQVHLRGNSQLTAEYQRYSDEDPLCCPSRTTIVEFQITHDVPVLRPLSASTLANQ